MAYSSIWFSASQSTVSPPQWSATTLPSKYGSYEQHSQLYKCDQHSATSWQRAQNSLLFPCIHACYTQYDLTVLLTSQSYINHCTWTCWVNCIATDHHMHILAVCTCALYAREPVWSSFSAMHAWRGCRLECCFSACSSCYMITQNGSRKILLLGSIQAKSCERIGREGEAPCCLDFPRQ